MENRKCLFCGSEFIVDEDKYKVYCSRKCKERARNKRRIKGINNIKTYHKKCEICGKYFDTEIVNKKYCSKECLNSINNKRNRDKNKKLFNLNIKNLKKIESNINKFIKQKIAENKKKEISLKNIKKCKFCGKEFVSKYKKFCSDECKCNFLKEQKIITQLKRRLDTSLKDTLNGRCKKDYKQNVIIHKLNKVEILGISFEGYKEYIEGLFSDGMSWDNMKDWDIDHIIPRCSFKFLDKNNNMIYKNVLKCFNYKNTRPLWKIDNYKKGVSDRLLSINKNIVD